MIPDRESALCFVCGKRGQQRGIDSPEMWCHRHKEGEVRWVAELVCPAEVMDIEVARPKALDIEASRKRPEGGSLAYRTIRRFWFGSEGKLFFFQADAGREETDVSPRIHEYRGQGR